MPTQSTIELKDLTLATDIGTYGPGDVVPDTHILDMSLTIDPSLVLIGGDRMEHVFDYDPLIEDIDRLAREHHYHTQEFLMTRIVSACAAYPQIQALSLSLRKSPVRAGTGSLGVRLEVDAPALAQIRATADAA
ncbi:MAG: dihydroneopterin aldolase [Pseudomonadota bacterium]